MPPLDADWSGVSLLNLPGERSWPITLATVLYVPTDATKRPLVGRLLGALLQQLLSDEAQALLPRFGFAALPAAARREVARQVAAAMVFDPSAPSWRFENGTERELFVCCCLLVLLVARHPKRTKNAKPFSPNYATPVLWKRTETTDSQQQHRNNNININNNA